jgi:hypothetical protein
MFRSASSFIEGMSPKIAFAPKQHKYIPRNPTPHPKSNTVFYLIFIAPS